MGKIKFILILYVLLSFFIYGAYIGQNIKNTAFVSYNIDGVDKNQTTNKVTAVISKTPAKIEFYSYSPNDIYSPDKNKKDIASNLEKDTNEILEPTYYINKNNVPILLKKAKLPNGTFIDTPVALPMQPTQTYLQNDLIIIKVTDLDQNTNKDTQESIKIELINPNTGDKENLILRESGKNSGKFIGFIQGRPGKTTQDDGILTLGTNDKITALYSDNETVKKIKANAVVAAVSSRLITTKTSSKNYASIGEYVKYTINVENISKIDINNINVKDLLPIGEKFVKGSLKINGLKAPAKISADGRTLSYTVAKLGAKSSIDLSYIALIGAGARKKELINQAWAITSFGERSNVSVATVKIKDDLSREHGYILGQVKDIDAINDTLKDSNASNRYGVGGVKIYMEDGRYTVTDKEGKYHFVNIDNGTHVVQIDTQSIKGRYKVAQCKDNTRFAGSKISQFVQLYHGEMARADFCLKKIAKNVTKIQMNISIRKIAKDEAEVTIKVKGDTNSNDLIAILELSEGLEYVKNSTSNNIEAEYRDNLVAVDIDKSRVVRFKIRTLPGAKPNKVINATLFYNIFNDINLKSDMASVSFKTGGKLNQEIVSMVSSKDTVTMQDAGGKRVKNDNVWIKPTHHETMPKYNAKDVSKMGNKAKIIWPPKGWVPNIPSAKVAILLPKGCSVKLKLNGKKVNLVHYEGVIRSINKQTKVIYFKGIDLKNGENIFEAIVKKGKKTVSVLSRKIYVESGAPASAEFLPEFSYLKADGIHSPVIAVRFRGKSGHLLRGGMVGSFEISEGYEPLIKSNGKGEYKIDSKGIAYIKLKPTTKAGEVALNFGNNMIVKTKLKPYLREWILVGFAKGTLGYSKLISHLKKGGSNIYHKGRIAFFAKGKVLGKWLMTISYDSGKSKRELFDTIDPKKFYTIYNDATIQKNEAPSSKKLYIKLEKDDFYTLFGDFKTDISGNEFLNYERTFTGLKSKYSKDNFNITVFGAKSSNEFVRDDIRGNGTSGYYLLSKKDIIQGSEKISIEIRDRHHIERVIKHIDLTRYKDYDIDYQNGTIYFKKPVFSMDKNFNPQFIVAKYEIKGINGSHYTYGAETSYKNKRIKAKAIYINENSGIKRNKLYGANIKIKLSKALKAYLEFAKSSNKIDGSRIDGNAVYAELNYQEQNLSAKIYYRKIDKNFGLEDESKVDGASTKTGAQVSSKISKNLTLNAQVYENKDYENNNTQKIKVLETKASYENNKTSATIGFRILNQSNSGTETQIIAGIKKSFLDDNLTLSLTHEQSISGKSDEYPTRTTLDTDYKYNDKTTIFFQIERSRIDNNTKYLARSGFNYKISKESNFKYSSQFEKTEDGSRLYDVYSIDRIFNINKDTKLKIAFERGEQELGNNSDNYNALSASLDYAHKNFNSKLRAEYRSGNDKKINLDAAAYYKKSNALTFAFGASYHKYWDENNKDIYSDANLAFAYRPEITNLIILDKIDFIYKKSQDKSIKNKTAKLVNNLHINYKASSNLELGLHYGLKYASDTIDGKSYNSFSDLFGINAIYDINNRFALGFQGSVLHSYSANNFDYSAGIYLDYSPWKNSVITFGYNITGFNDEDFSQQNYHKSGLYLQFKIKFDQSSFNKGGIE